MERRRAVTALVGLLLLAGCVADPTTEPSQPVFDSSATFTADDLYYPPQEMAEFVWKVKQATYVVECPGTEGSGWGVQLHWQGATQSFIVTAHHVIESCLDEKVEPTILNHKFDSFSGVVTVSDFKEADPDEMTDEQDLALITPSIEDFKTLDSLNSRGYPLGSWVMTSSYPGLDDDFYMYTVTTGNIASLGGLLGIVMTAAVNPGASGGVVVNSRGQVLGTIVAGYDQTELNDVAYFLPVANLWQLMAKLPEKKVSGKE